MTPGKVYGLSKLEENNPRNSLILFLKEQHFEIKNPPKFENDLKWPTFRETVKSSNYSQERGREA